MNLLEETYIFAAIIKEGGFNKAAKKLGLSNGLITRKIKQLEEKLGVSLLTRTTRKLKLTHEGSLYLKHAERIYQELAQGLILLSTATSKPKGHIRISSTTYYSRYFLTPIIEEFIKDFPDITIEIIASNEVIDPLEYNIDLLFRGRGFMSRADKDEHLRGRYLFEYTIGIYASQEYLAKYGEPQHPNDLINYKVIGYSNLFISKGEENWNYEHKGKAYQTTVKPIFCSDDMESNLAMCKAGIGIGRFSSLAITPEIEGKGLRRILTDFNFGKYEMYALYPYQAGVPKRVRILLDYLLARLPAIAIR